MKVAFEEIGRVSVSFAAEAGEAGQVCKLVGNGKVGPCGAGDVFAGVLEGIRKGIAGVQIHGFAEVSYSGSDPEAGFVKLAADGQGGVSKMDTGREHLVVWVDKAGKKLMMEL